MYTPNGQADFRKTRSIKITVGPVFSICEGTVIFSAGLTLDQIKSMYDVGYEYQQLQIGFNDDNRR